MNLRRRRLPLGRRSLIMMASLCALFAYGVTAGSGALPSGFQETTVFTGLTNPTAVEFASDGRVFVAEKRGVVKVFDNLSDTTPTVFADLRTNVYNFWDRGLLGLALDPSFPDNPYVYVLYTYDAEPGGTAPRWGAPGVDADPCPTPPGATADGCVVTGRLSRLTADGNVMTGAEQVLLTDWCQQYPSHSIGSLAFGPNGELYVSGGDGASFNFADYGQDGTPLNPCGDPPAGVGGTMTPPTAEGGALRSQDVRTAADPTSLDGAILRIDPSTGDPFPGNPASGSDANASRIVAHGLRNPFRITVRPGTNEVWAGDVGWNTWEEINRVADLQSVKNFGWPCYEGAGRMSSYDNLNLTLCENLYAAGAGAVVAPYYTYNHGSQVVSGETCPTGSSSIAGLAFYPVGGPFPDNYDGALFFADYSRDCIWVMFAGAGGLPDPTTRATFLAPAANPVGLEVGPDGSLYYPDFDGGTIRRIAYFSSNQPPIASATATPTSGPAPLQVAFDGTASSDPDGQPITYAWDLDGDGQFDDSTARQPSYTYTQPGTYSARLRVTDTQGATGTTQAITVTANNTPPTATITGPAASTTWSVGDTVTFAGSATDPQQGTLPGSALRWDIVLQHCPSTCHPHTITSVTGASGSFVAPDHEYPSYVELRLTATDAGGLTDTKTLRLDPKTWTLGFATSPTGLQLTVGGTTQTAPFSRTVIRGSANSISAPSPQGSYEWVSWSDGGAIGHDVVATADATYTATFRVATADLGLAKTVSPSGSTPSWTLTVTNGGPLDASGVVVTDVLPTRLSIGTVPTGCTYDVGTRTLRCSASSLASGTSVSFTFTTTITGKGNGWITNTAQVSSSTPDGNTGNNSASAKVRP